MHLTFAYQCMDYRCFLFSELVGALLHTQVDKQPVSFQIPCNMRAEDSGVQNPRGQSYIAISLRFP